MSNDVEQAGRAGHGWRTGAGTGPWTGSVAYPVTRHHDHVGGIVPRQAPPAGTPTGTTADRAGTAGAVGVTGAGPDGRVTGAGPDGTPGRWTVDLPGREPVAWTGFATGPVVLHDDELDRLSRVLTGVGLDRIGELAAAEVVPFVAGEGPSPPALLLHSATSTTKGFEGDLTDLAQGRHPYDVAAYLETRVVALAAPGDLAVGRTLPWREAVTVLGVDHVDLGDLDHYYLCQAMLVAAEAYQIAGVRGTDVASLPITAVLRWLAARPEAVLRIYALDREMQILAVWLRRNAGLDVLRCDANNPVVSNRWNQKNQLHPEVSAAEAVEVGGLGPAEALAREQLVADGHVRLGMALAVLPGYTVRRRGRTSGQFGADLLRAAKLMASRHGVEVGCLKPSEAGDGARIVTDLPLTDLDRLLAEAAEAVEHGDDYLLEANVEFLTFTAAGREFLLSPSGHIRNGHVAPGLTVQLMDGRSWEGNAYVDARTCESVGLSTASYHEIRRTLVTIRDAFHGPQARMEGCHAGLVTGGIDFAVGRVGGRFGETVFAAPIDFNLSSHGAEYLRAFLERVGSAGMPGAGPAVPEQGTGSDVPEQGTGTGATGSGATGAGRRQYAATRVYRPSPGTGLAETVAAVREAAPEGETVATIACVPGSWGMIAATGPDPIGSIENALGIVERLADAGLAVPRPKPAVR